MRIEPRRRRGLARFGVVLAVASALALTVTGSPANAAAGGQKATRNAPATDPIGNPTIRFTNVNSGLCLAYDPKSRGAARQEGCDDDNTVFWEAASNGNGQYELIDLHNNQCLSIAGGSTADSATVFVYNCANTPDQLFTLVPEFSSYPGAYELVNVNSGKCVAVGGARTNKGAWVIQWTCAASGEFMWRPY
ncbi:RICIN domain-containing protein [Streptomyces sp. NBC_00433]